jgi:quinohemoprotein ethanol dehydrogenase
VSNIHSIIEHRFWGEITVFETKDTPFKGGHSLVLVLFLVLTISACERAQQPSESSEAESATQSAPTSQQTVVDDQAMADESQGENWLAFGRTYSEQRFSPLDQVNTSNISDLKVDWYMDLPNDRGLVSTPLVVDGILYFIGSMNRVRAVDAQSGELIWEFDPEVAKNTGNDMRVGWEHNRGIGIWKDKVYVATWDGRLIAVTRDTGDMVWSVRTFPAEAPLYITGAPKIFKGKVLIGNGGTEAGPTRGYVTAYDAETGEQAWRFYIVPGNPADGFENEAMEMAAETWTGEWWIHGGGGNAWHGFTYDAELDQLYIGTGNGAPWNRRIRSPEGGDNLFLCSVVALDPDTGDYLWHYQTTPGETWDYNSNMDIVLADLEMGGEPVKALMHAPKNGFFYVIDRSNGELLLAEPFSKTTWASHIDMETGRPVEVPGARYEDGPVMVAPTAWGAHSWHAMSYNPETGLAYIPAMHLDSEYSDEGVEYASWRSAPFLEGDTMGVAIAIDEDPDKIGGTLQAFDPVRGEIVWEVTLPGRWNSGTLTTAGGLVFQGRANGHLVAHDATNGEELWNEDLGLGISAPPITYSVDGKQFIALLVGWGGGGAGIANSVDISHGWAYGQQTRRLVAFSLEGTQSLPASAPPVIVQPIPMPEFELNESLATQGGDEYGRCWACHGIGVKAGGMAPDLRASAIVASSEAFADVVRGGSRKENGMPEFGHLTDEQLEALRHFIRKEAEAALE